VCAVLVVGGARGRRQVLQSLNRDKLFFLLTISDLSSLELFSITDFAFKSCWE